MDYGNYVAYIGKKYRTIFCLCYLSLFFPMTKNKPYEQFCMIV